MRLQDLGIGRLFEWIRDAAIVADAKSQRIVFWNQAATNIFGYSVEEALGLHIEDLVPRYPKDQHRVDIARYAATGHWPYTDLPSQLELPALRKGGEEIYVELSLSSIGLEDDADGNERYVLAIVRDITERKWAEEEIRRLTEDLENRVAERTEQLEKRERMLRKSEERYRSFIEQTTEGICRIALEEPVPTSLTPDEQVECFYYHGYLAECNDSMAKIYGYARAEELVGVRLGDLLPSSIRDNVEYLRAFVRSGYRLTGAESQEVDRHGNIKYFSNNITGIVESESLLYLWRTQQDITERKQGEQARSRLAAIVESSDDAILSKTLDGIVTSWNRGAQEIYGDSVEEIVGKPIFVLALPDRYNEISDILEKVRRGEHIDHYETIRLKKDGDRINVSITVSPITDSAGNVVGASTIARDITGRKRAEEAVEQSELLYRTVIEQATENIFLVDVETRRIVESNPAFQKTLDYAEEELRSLTLYDIVAADRKSIDINIQRSLRQMRRFIGERKYRRKDGSLVDVEVSASIILRNGRETLCVVAHDVTERKKNEEMQRFLAEAGASLSDTRMADHSGSSEPSSSWGVVIGDVSGKGAEAAAVLALARYTIRTLATRESHPSAVLDGLNEAMLRQRREHDNYKLCTVAYASLETNEGDTEHKAKVTVCCGGHSPPFLLKADGSIYKIGQPGRVLGVFDDTNLTEQEAHLAPGDVLVLYTDGVVEARSPEGTFFGEERLMTILRSSVALDASTMAGRIEGAVLNFQEQNPRDDIAILVLRVSD